MNPTLIIVLALILILSNVFYVYTYTSCKSWGEDEADGPKMLLGISIVMLVLACGMGFYGLRSAKKNVQTSYKKVKENMRLKIQKKLEPPVPIL